jgi:hypothetical protein
LWGWIKMQLGGYAKDSRRTLRHGILPFCREEDLVEPEKAPRERLEDLVSLLVGAWRPTAQQVLWSVRIVLATGILLCILALVGRPFGITLWDWIKLLVVPAVIAAGGLWFNSQQRDRELESAERRAQDEALQAYLDQMSDMLIPNKDQPSLYIERPGGSLSEVILKGGLIRVREVARARTLTVLPRLDGTRKVHVVQFLYESGLIYKERILILYDESDRIPVLEKRHNIVSLEQADLREADLSHANLSGANLFDANLFYADLSEADLSGVDLRRAIPNYANLSGATLSGATLHEANLSEANLSGADLSEHTDLSRPLSGATLSGANLSGANLSGANLSGTDLGEHTDLRLSNTWRWVSRPLSGADLSGAKGWTDAQLRAARSLKGATMPDGQTLRGDDNPDGPTFEEWLQGRTSEKPAAC